MEWQDEGIIIRTQPYKDHGLIVTLFTHHHGKHAGLVRTSRRQLGNPFQLGTVTSATWQARLADHLGSYRLEVREVLGQRWFQAPQPLLILQTSCSLLDNALPEHDPHPRLFEEFLAFLQCLDTTISPRQEYALFEKKLLEHLGFGLDLSKCVVTGKTTDLMYISPKSGHAVCEEAGAPYKEKLFALPSFFLDPAKVAPEHELLDALSITGFFLEKHVVRGHRSPLPPLRQLLLNAALPHKLTLD